ncbi:MAG: hypothetical protein NVS2B3_03130 [Vulcanimicrobiaceae bacterium]
MTTVRVLALHGDLDIEHRAYVDRELDQLTRLDPDTATIVDLSDVRFIDTTFLDGLARVGRAVGTAGRETTVPIVSPHDFFRRVLHIAAFDILFPIFDDLAAARRSLLAA